LVAADAATAADVASAAADGRCSLLPC
jgi:hypothetical protein